jgi:Raf kinase inhibitor-like YbhB/YbcL family protein
MLQNLPRALGRALRPIRPGPARIALSELNADPRKGSIDVFSSAFRDGAAIPARYTADGEGVSPSMQWRGVPGGTAAIIVIMEDMDSPTPHPLVHAIVWGLSGSDGGLPEGALSNARARAEGPPLGRNSYLTTRYLPPDPPPGHGPHRYAIEVIALDVAPDFHGTPGRSDVIEGARGHVIGAGCLIGTYARA